MKKLLFALAILLAPATAFAQCNGNFSASHFCGTGASSGGAPGQQPYSAIFNTLPLANGDIFMGNGSNIATAVAPVSAGDCTWVVNNTGTFTQTCTKTNGVAFAPSATTDTTNATNITGGTLNTARLPSPFTNGTRQGNTLAFVTYSGSAPTSGHIATYDASGNIQDGGGSTGTVTTTGSPANFQTSVFTGATSISGVSPGTIGQALISNGGSNYPSYQSGTWTLLNTLVASNSTSLSDTTHFTSNYKEYRIIFENILAATNATTCQLQVNTAGGVQNTGYISTASVGSTAYAGTSTTGFISCGLPSGAGGNFSTSGPGISGEITAYNWGNGNTTIFNGHVGSLATVSTWNNANIGGFWNSATALTGITIVMTSGNITSGTIKIYGRL